MENATAPTATLTPREILLNNSGFFRSPNTYFCSFTGEFMGEYERWSNNLKKPLHEGARPYEGVEATEYGFAILFDYGMLCPPSLLHFPKWATETDYLGAFGRLTAYIKANYEWQPGLAPFSNSWD